MRTLSLIVSLVVTLAVFGAGVVFMYARYERYVQNQKIEAQNHRKGDANKVVKAINSLDGHSRDCSDWLAGLATGQFQQESTTTKTALFFSENCAKGVISRADEATTAIAKVAGKEVSEPGRTEFLAEARAVVEVYRSQSDDFDRAFRMLKAAGSQSARSALTPEVGQLLNRAIPAINRGLDSLESSRKAYIYPDS